MKLTLSVIKADIGSIGGHIQPSVRLLETVRDHVAAHCKDLIIESVHHSELFGSGFAYFAVLAGVPLPQNCVDPLSGPLSNALEAILQRVAENHRESNEHVPSASRGSRRRILTRWTSVYLQ